MKVLYASMQFGRGYAQGTERYLELLIGGLAARGHAAVVLAGDPEHRGRDLALGDEVAAAPRVLHYPSWGWASVRGYPVDALERLIGRERPDLVHLANPGHIGVNILAAAQRRGVPGVVTVMDQWWACPKHSLWHYSGRLCGGDVPWRECLTCIAHDDPRSAVQALVRWPGPGRRLLPVLYRRAARRRGAPDAEWRAWQERGTVLRGVLENANAVIFLSRSAAERFAPRLRREQVHQIPVGLGPEWYTAAPPRRPLPADVADWVVGFAGALAEHKGAHVLLAAAARLGWRNTRIRLAGPAPDVVYAARLRGLARGLNVEFVGALPPAAMPDYLRSLDLLVIPSIGVENLPQVAAQGAAVGVPMVVSRTPGLAEAVPDERMRFAPGSEADLANCLAAWFRAPEHVPPARPPMAEEMIARTLDVYAACLRGGTAGC